MEWYGNLLLAAILVTLIRRECWEFPLEQILIAFTDKIIIVPMYTTNCSKRNEVIMMPKLNSTKPLTLNMINATTPQTTLSYCSPKHITEQNKSSTLPQFAGDLKRNAKCFGRNEKILATTMWVLSGLGPLLLRNLRPLICSRNSSYFPVAFREPPSSNETLLRTNENVCWYLLFSWDLFWVSRIFFLVFWKFEYVWPTFTYRILMLTQS